MNVTTGGVKDRASMFIKTVLEAAFGFSQYTTKATLNHVDNIESITRRSQKNLGTKNHAKQRNEFLPGFLAFYLRYIVPPRCTMPTCTSS